MIYLFAGQSNTLGYLNEGPAPYVPTARVQMWTDTNGDGVGDAFNYLRPGWNTGTAANPHAWGPEVAFAAEWLDHNAEGTLYLGKVAKGSTGLAQDEGALDWSPESTGELFDQATRVSHDMRATLGVERLDGIAWMQGETDATDAAKASAYHDNLAEFAQEARFEWGATDIALGRIGAAGAYSQAVREAQWLLDQEDDHLTSFKTLDFGLRPDGLHYDAEGQIALGNAFYDGWIA